MTLGEFDSQHGSCTQEFFLAAFPWIHHSTLESRVEVGQRDAMLTAHVTEPGRVVGHFGVRFLAG